MLTGTIRLLTNSSSDAHPGPSGTARPSSSRQDQSDEYPDVNFIEVVKNFTDESTGDTGEQAARVLESKKRLIGHDRTITVRALVDFAHQDKGKIPSNDELRSVCKSFLGRHEEACKDELNGKKLKETSGSLARQMIVRKENMHRNKNKAGPSKRMSAHRGEEIRPEPSSLTEKQLQTLQKEMKQMYSRGSQFWVWPDIKQNMKETYYLQRKIIEQPRPAPEEQNIQDAHQSEEEEEEDGNLAGKSPVEMLIHEFPFLFTLSGMVVHLEVQWGLDFYNEIDKFKGAQDCGIVCKYLTSTSKQKFECLKLETRQANALQGITQQARSTSQLILLLRMLAAHFEEDISCAIHFLEVRKVVVNLHFLS